VDKTLLFGDEFYQLRNMMRREMNVNLLAAWPLGARIFHGISRLSAAIEVVATSSAVTTATERDIPQRTKVLMPKAGSRQSLSPELLFRKQGQEQGIQ
jgi:hypothetical protein